MAEDDLEKIKGELKAYKAQLETLRDEVALLFQFSTVARVQIFAYAKGASPSFDPVLVEKMQKARRKVRHHRGILRTVPLKVASRLWRKDSAMGPCKPRKLG